ncbi:hypothetical protein DACRYDRAFT_25142 [Dacryopinax primogenitus]|uniref:Uncharacterized protein n=1 Tax=Dacryopinax primogenitus (strain DJM 731) TaxID=1858805 RepID=M5FR64_DACPD|nr:uncharacterized protein DACRYDRAFT_25142 [Dacryopinax primogenitus]EJT97374.1 hypothetical protein DACRYDRAFT_25142 [Dacryopinax primogenitus]
MERDENNEDASPKSNINNSTDAFALVSTFAAEFVDGPEYENHVGDIATFTFVPFMPPCIPNPDMISPIRSFARSSRGDCGSPRHEFAMADGDSEKAMSQFFDFTSGSEASPRHLHSQVVSPVASEA